LKSFFTEPEEHPGVEHLEPLLKRTIAQASFELSSVQRLLISDDGSAICFMFNCERFRSLPRQDRTTNLDRDFEQFEQSLSAEQTVTLYTVEAVTLGHVIKTRVMFRQ
jgi:hypothetical protein